MNYRTLLRLSTVDMHSVGW